MRSALPSRAAVGSDSCGRSSALSPAASRRVSLRKATVTSLWCLGGLATGRAEPVMVSVQPVSHATRRGSERPETSRDVRRTLIVSCGPRGAGSVGTWGGGGVPSGPSAPQVAAGGAVRTNCWTRLLSLSVTVSVPWQSTLTAVGWMNWPGPSPRWPKASRRSPSGPKRSMRLLPRSATQRSPSPSTVICAGTLSLPSLDPVPPKSASWLPSGP